MKKLLKQWDDITQDVAYAFLEKYYCDDETTLVDLDWHWVADEIGSILCVADHFHDFLTMYKALQSKCPPARYFEWYDMAMEAHHTKSQYMNFSTFLKTITKKKKDGSLKYETGVIPDILGLKPYWTRADGEKILYEDLADDHLMNIIKDGYRNTNLKKEAKKRKFPYPDRPVDRLTWIDQARWLEAIMSSALSGNELACKASDAYHKGDVALYKLYLNQLLK